MQIYIRRLLYATVFITGAAVLVIEVAAVRILSPFYGSSIYVLSSVLTIILGALSLGYYVGGKISDRSPRHEPLFVIITMAGLSILLMNLLSTYTLPIGSLLFSVATGPLLFGMFLFFLPAFLLGIDSPYVIKLQSQYASEDTRGAAVGTTFFWSTIGSILGSLATGFLFIPFLGIHTTILSVGILLVCLGLVMSIILSILTRKSDHETLCVILVRNRYYFGVVALSLVLLVWFTLRYTTPAALAMVYESDSLYSKIAVQDVTLYNRTVRLLKNDANNSSAIYPDSYEFVFGYAQFAPLYADLKPNAQDWLLIGGGAYNIPRWLMQHSPTASIDVAEIDPELFEVAQKYFDLTDISRVRNNVVDGRVFLKQTDRTYDVVFGDAFNTDYNIPAHLTTYEFFTTLKSRMKPEGIFMMNYVGTLKTDAPTLTGSLYKTMREVFPHVEMYAFGSYNPEAIQNIVFVARNGEEPITLDPKKLLKGPGKTWKLGDMHMKSDYFDLENELILTDDKAPVEYLMFKQS